MKSITIICNNRFNYLRVLCDSLVKNDLKDWNIYCLLEPNGRKCKEILEKTIPITDLIINNYKFGCHFNSLQAWGYSFEYKKSDFNLFLEEDIILSPDALNLTNWFVSNYSNDLSKFALVLHNYTNNININNKICKKHKSFTTFGIGMTKENYYSYLRPNILNNTQGWDYGILNTLKSNEIYTVLPEFSRANHIGAFGGEHCSKEFHDEKFRDLLINNNIVQSNEFKLVD